MKELLFTSAIANVLIDYRPKSVFVLRINYRLEMVFVLRINYRAEIVCVRQALPSLGGVGEALVTSFSHPFLS